MESGKSIVDNFSERGAKRVEERLPNLLDDIKSIVDEGVTSIKLNLSFLKSHKIGILYFFMIF